MTTLGDLYKSKDITEEALDAAVRAYLKDPGEGARDIGNGVTLDIAAAIQGHTYTRDVMANPEAPDGQRRNAVRTAMLLAVVKAKP